MVLVRTSVPAVTGLCMQQRSAPLMVGAITHSASLACPVTGPWVLAMLSLEKGEKPTAATATSPSEYLQAIFLPDSMYTVS